MTTDKPETLFELPPMRTAPLRVNPQTALFYGHLKVGKTSACAALPDSLVLELQPGGADFCTTGRFLDIKGPDDLVATLEQFAKLRKEGKLGFSKLIVDHLGILDDWVQAIALRNYCEFPMARKEAASYKRVTDIPGPGDKGGSPGWAWLWDAQAEMYKRIIAAAPEIIFIAHVRPKYVATQNDVVASDDVDIDGKKARMLFCGNTSAIGRFYRKQENGEDRLIVSFKTNEAITCGCALPRLSGTEHVIARTKIGAKELPVYDWSQIYLPETSKNGAP